MTAHCICDMTDSDGGGRKGAAVADAGADMSDAFSNRGGLVIEWTGLTQLGVRCARLAAKLATSHTHQHGTLDGQHAEECCSTALSVSAAVLETLHHACTAPQQQQHQHPYNPSGSTILQRAGRDAFPRRDMRLGDVIVEIIPASMLLGCPVKHCFCL